VVLEGLENILKVGRQDAKTNGANNLYADFVEEADGLEKLEVLQIHQNITIYQKAVKILEEYFGCEDEDQMAQMQFGISEVNNFTF